MVMHPSIFVLMNVTKKMNSPLVYKPEKFQGSRLCWYIPDEQHYFHAKIWLTNIPTCQGVPYFQCSSQVSRCGPVEEGPIRRGASGRVATDQGQGQAQCRLSMDRATMLSFSDWWMHPQCTASAFTVTMMFPIILMSLDAHNFDLQHTCFLPFYPMTFIWNIKLEMKI